MVENLAPCPLPRYFPFASYCTMFIFVCCCHFYMPHFAYLRKVQLLLCKDAISEWHVYIIYSVLKVRSLVLWCCHYCVHVQCRNLVVSIHCLEMNIKVFLYYCSCCIKLPFIALTTNLRCLNLSLKVGTVILFYSGRLFLLPSLHGVTASGVSCLFFPLSNLLLCTLSFIHKVTLPFFFTCSPFQARNTTTKQARTTFLKKTSYTDVTFLVDNEQSLHSCMNSV